MAAAETARLIAELSLDVRKFTTGADKAMSKLSKLGAKSTAIGTAVGVGLERLAEAGIRKLTGAVTGGLESLAQLEDATTSVDGAIKQVGLTGKVTSGQVAQWANEIEASVQAAFDDKEITQATTTLLRFGKVTPGNLRPAMVVMTDLATKTGSVDSAASLLAKALADPAKAAGKLARSGVILTKSQQDTIKAMVEAGDVAGAQKFILQELAKATDGAAKAAHGPFRDSQLVLADVVEDAQRALGTGLLPVIMEVRDELSKELAKPETLRRIKEMGQGLADGFREAVKWIKSVPWDQVGAVAKGLLDFGKGIASAFMGLPTEAKSLILGLAAINKLSGGGVIKIGVDMLTGAGGALFSQFLGRGSIANPMVVVPVGGSLGGGAPAIPGGPAGMFAGALLPVTIAAIAPAALVLLTESLLGGTAKIQERDRIARQETNIARGGSGAVPNSHLEGGRGGVHVTNAGAAPLRVTNVGMSPDERQELNDQKSAIDRIRTNAESNRIALVGAQRTGTQQIVAAIRANRTVVAVNVQNRTVTTTYANGTTVRRTISQGSYNAGLSG